MEIAGNGDKWQIRDTAFRLQRCSDHTYNRHNVYAFPVPCLQINSLPFEQGCVWPSWADMLVSYLCLTEKQAFDRGVSIQRDLELRRPTTGRTGPRGHRPPGHVQTRFTKYLLALCSMRNECTAPLIMTAVFLENSIEVQSTLEKSGSLENLSSLK